MKANIHEAKSRLYQLAEAAVNGERVVIAKSGKPFVELIPCRADKRPPFGWLKEEVQISDDFDSPSTSAELSDLFEGKA